MGKWKFKPGDTVIASEKALVDYQGRHVPEAMLGALSERSTQ